MQQEELVARAGLGGHCERLGGSERETAELKWGGRGAPRKLMEVMSVGLGNLDVRVLGRGRSQDPNTKLSWSSRGGGKYPK